MRRPRTQKGGGALSSPKPENGEPHEQLCRTRPPRRADRTRLPGDGCTTSLPGLMTGRILMAVVLFGAPLALGLLLARLRPADGGIALSRLDLLVPAGFAVQLLPVLPRSLALATGYAILLVWGVVRLTTARGLGKM